MTKEYDLQPPTERYFAMALVEIRKYRLRLTQPELAQKLTARGFPMSQGILTNIEVGRRRITLDDACQIAAELGTTPHNMIEYGKTL